MTTMSVEKRAKLIARINAKTHPPTPEQLRALQDRGHADWGEYILDAADNHGISVGSAYTLFQMLGETEAFDAFVTSLEDGEYPVLE